MTARLLLAASAIVVLGAIPSFAREAGPPEATMSPLSIPSGVPPAPLPPARSRIPSHASADHPIPAILSNFVRDVQAAATAQLHATKSMEDLANAFVHASKALAATEAKVRDWEEYSRSLYAPALADKKE